MSIPNPPASGQPTPPPVPPQVAPPPTAPHGTPPPAAPYGAMPPALAGAPVPPGKKNVLAIVALVVAAVGFIFACIPGALIVGWVLLPIAFVLSIVSLFLKGRLKWMGIVALVLSIVGTIVGFVVFFAVVSTAVDEAFDESFAPDTAVSQPAEQSADAEEAASADDPADTREEMVLVETAFGRSSYDPSTWWYVAIFDNPNADFVFSSAALDVEALDAQGTILDSSSDYRAILSGKSAVAGNFLSVGDGQIEKIELRGPAATDATRSPASETGSLTIDGITPTTDDYSTTVHGKVTSSFSEDQEYVQVVVVARDGSGKIIGAETGYVDRLPTGGSAQFEVMFFDPLPAGTTYEAYGAL